MSTFFVDEIISKKILNILYMKICLKMDANLRVRKFNVHSI